MSNDDKTRIPEQPRPPWQDNPRSVSGAGGRTAAPPPRAGSGDGGGKFDSGTIVLGGSGQPVARQGGGQNGDATVVFDPKRLPQAAGGGVEPALQRPTVGWLVVIAGPGVGNIFALNYGHNSVGRGQDARIRLNFGDQQISEKISLYVSYDGMSRQFFARAGEGQSMAYVNRTPVMGVSDLPPNAEILIGATRMRFVPLCGPDFDWQQSVDAAG